MSRTFEGRDRFAPAAAWLAKGIQLSALGRPVNDIQRLDIPLPEEAPSSVRGVVLRVDRFGNLVTNIDRKTVERLGHGSAIAIDAGGHRVERLVATYAELARRRRRRAVRQHRSPRARRPLASAADRLGLVPRRRRQVDGLTARLGTSIQSAVFITLLEGRLHA